MAIPTLTPAQMYHAHLIDCRKCHTAIKGNPSVASSFKLRDLLCPVGRKLFDIAARSDPKSVTKMTSFPFVAKLYQEVVANIKGTWEKGRVVDRSLSANGRVVGYEVEVKRPRPYGMPIIPERYYVNSINVRKAGADKPLKEKTEVATDKYIITIGGK